MELMVKLSTKVTDMQANMENKINDIQDNYDALKSKVNYFD